MDANSARRKINAGDILTGYWKGTLVVFEVLKNHRVRNYVTAVPGTIYEIRAGTSDELPHLMGLDDSEIPKDGVYIFYYAAIWQYASERILKSYERVPLV